MTLGKVGDKVQDCDPRCSHRKGEIVEVFARHYAIRWNTGKILMLAFHRLHTKGIKSGVRLLPSEKPTKIESGAAPREEKRGLQDQEQLPERGAK